MSSTAESLPGLLREWLGRSGVLPLSIHFFHGHGDQDLDSSSSEGYPIAKDTRMTETLEIATCLIIDILNLHSGRWRSLNLTARADIFERFSSSSEPTQLVTLDLKSTPVRESPLTVPKFMVNSELNLTSLKLAEFPLTSINIRWANITHATFSVIVAAESLDVLRRASSLESYRVCVYGCHDIGFINPILHPTPFA
jgi:hypothetical protein